MFRRLKGNFRQDSSAKRDFSRAAVIAAPQKPGVSA